MHHLAVADVHAHVADRAVEEHQVAGLQLGRGRPACPSATAALECGRRPRPRRRRTASGRSSRTRSGRRRPRRRGRRPGPARCRPRSARRRWARRRSAGAPAPGRRRAPRATCCCCGGGQRVVLRLVVRDLALEVRLLRGDVVVGLLRLRPRPRRRRPGPASASSAAAATSATHVVGVPGDGVEGAELVRRTPRRSRWSAARRARESPSPV